MIPVLTNNLGCLGRQPSGIYHDVSLSLINSLRIFADLAQTILKGILMNEQRQFYKLKQCISEEN